MASVSVAFIGKQKELQLKRACWLEALFCKCIHLPLQRMAQTGFVSYTNGGSVVLTHGLGVVPLLVLAEIRIDTTHSGLTAGTIYEIAAGYGGVDTIPSTTSQVTKTNTQVTWIAPNAGLLLGGGALTGVDPTKASVNVRCFA